MNENPYLPPGIPEKAEPPLRPDNRETDEVASLRSLKRPMAVKFLCGVYFLMALLGVWKAYGQIDFMVHKSSGSDLGEWVVAGVVSGIPLLLVFVGSPGLWLGRGWGFFTLGFLSALLIARDATFMMYDIPRVLEPAGFDWGPSLFYTLIHLGVQMLAFFYLLTPPVLVYCGRPVGRRWLYFAVLLTLGGAWVVGVKMLLIHLVLYLEFVW